MTKTRRCGLTTPAHKEPPKTYEKRRKHDGCWYDDDVVVRQEDRVHQWQQEPLVLLAGDGLLQHRVPDLSQGTLGVDVRATKGRLHRFALN